MTLYRLSIDSKIDILLEKHVFLIPFFAILNPLSFFLSVIKTEAFECRSEVKSFDVTKLRRVQTRVRNSLPTPQILRAELRPERLPDVSAIRAFDCKLLKHVEVRERNLLPTLAGKVFYRQ